MTTIGSLFSGYSGLDLAASEAFDASVAWHVERDANPSRILAHHYPGIPNHGDVTRINWEEIHAMPNHRNDALAEAMYADYCSGMSLEQVGAKWERSRQTVWKMFDRRCYSMRPTYTGTRDRIEYRGQNYTLGNGGYYRSTTGDRHFLHRRVYEDAHGAIPDGWDIHHIDHDKANNAISNLVAMTKADHARFHSQEEVVPGSPTIDILTGGYP